MPYCLHTRQIPALKPSGMHPDSSVPSGHTVHAKHCRFHAGSQLLFTSMYFPGEHVEHVAHSVRNPVVSAYVPRGHATQSPAYAFSHPLRYCPAGHSVSQTLHESRYPVPVAYLPSSQALHVPLKEVLPPHRERYLPGSHTWPEHCVQLVSFVAVHKDSL